MNEKRFEEAIRTTLKELCSMSHKEFHIEMEKRKNSDFARIFSEAYEPDDDYPVQVKQHNIAQYKFEEKLEKLLNEVVEKQLKKILPTVVEEVLLRVEQRV